MPAGFWIARLFCIAGGVLAFVGLILWWALPIPLSLPPYLFTAVLAVGYGVFCWKNGHSTVRPPEAEKKEPSE